MGKKKGHEVTDRDVANAFTALFEVVLVPQSKEEAEEIIRQKGIDLEKWNAEMYVMAQELLRSSPLNWRNVNQAELSQKVKRLESIPKRLDKTKEQLQDLIRQRLDELNLSPQQVPVAHRNQEELTKEDLASLLQELEFQLQEEEGENKE